MSVSQSTLVNSARQNDSLTENGAVTNSTTLNDVLNLFFLAGASRNIPETELKALILSAMVEDKESALKVIFWAGDIRGGAGERRFFKVALSTLADYYPETFRKNFQHVAEFNRYDSLFQFDRDEEVLAYLTQELEAGKGLLAKWLPREGKIKNQKFLKAFLKHTGMSNKQYRKKVVALSKTVETSMSNKDYTFNYSHVPSVAFNKYRKAFFRNDLERFSAFVEAAKNGEAKINAGAIFPYDIYRSYNGRGGDAASVDAQWGQLPNYMEGSNERILPVCDVSGSMNGLPMEISISLGVYISERNNSIFKDAFITFSESPEMNYLQGTTTQRFDILRRANWGMNTNLQATFQLILNAGLANNIPQNEMPTKLLIISDMEFDRCGQNTNLDAMKAQFKAAGYTIPDIVFWNVDGRSTSNFPVSFNDEGVALVSGASPTILKSVLGGSLDPMKVMYDTIGAERYSVLKA